MSYARLSPIRLSPELTHCCSIVFLPGGRGIRKWKERKNIQNSTAQVPYETVSGYIAEKIASKGWRFELDSDEPGPKKRIVNCQDIVRLKARQKYLFFILYMLNNGVH